ncbi:MAG: glycosyltransferase family 4 protein, partial [Kiritimatiellae bacterium]|nr:glycosyltransferase family 4 protein [Kiritimatiellia bacterium]
EGLIEFAGYSDDMVSEYASCAFVAFPSLDEGFPLTIVDAAASAKPCVMVEDWIGTAAAGGGIVTKPTVGAYAEGLRRLMADTELRWSLGWRAREFCAEHFSRARILDKWEALLIGYDIQSSISTTR